MKWVYPQKLQSRSSNVPSPRWGHSSCVVNEYFFIILGFDGEYASDIWRLNLKTFLFEKMKSSNQKIARSNHSSLFYFTKQLIYIFGGNKGETKYNDTWTLNPYSGKLNQIEVKGDIPEERAYHGAQIIDNYMFIVGGENTSDLNDVYGLNLETYEWKRFIVDIPFASRRFHSISADPSTKRLFVFGGCQANYEPFGDLIILDCQDFFLTNDGTIQCSHIDLHGPQPRWGHSSNYYDGKIYIFGGRNKSEWNDFNDLHVFNINKKKWEKKNTDGEIPVGRRRHSSEIIGSCMLIFGGFDGGFLNDFYFIDVKPRKINFCHSSIENDFSRLIQTGNYSDICFSLDDNYVKCHKALLLSLISRNEMEKSKLIRMICGAKLNQIIDLNNFLQGNYFTIDIFKSLLEFLYCGTFVSNVSINDLEDVISLANSFDLEDTCNSIIKFKQQATQNIQDIIINKIKKSNYTQQQYQKIYNDIQMQIFSQQIINMKSLCVDSPEIFISNSFVNQKLYNLPYINKYSDMTIQVEEKEFRVQKAILAERSEYFRNLVSFEDNKNESSKYMLKDICSEHFEVILEYLYTDQFSFTELSYNLLFTLLKLSDYLQIPRLLQICCIYLSEFMSLSTINALYIIGYVYNAKDLIEICLNFLSKYPRKVIKKVKNMMKKVASPDIVKYFKKDLHQLYQEKFVDINYQIQQTISLSSSNETKIEIELIDVIAEFVPDPYKSDIFIQSIKQQNLEQFYTTLTQDLSNPHQIKNTKNKKLIEESFPESNSPSPQNGKKIMEINVKQLEEASPLNYRMRKYPKNKKVSQFSLVACQSSQKFANEKCSESEEHKLQNSNMIKNKKKNCFQKLINDDEIELYDSKDSKKFSLQLFQRNDSQDKENH